MSTKPRDLPSKPDFPYPGDWLDNLSSLVIVSVVLFILIFGTTIFLSFRHFEEAKENALSSDKITANLLADIIMEHNKATVGILQSYAHRPLLVNAAKSKDIAGVHRHLSDLKKNGEIDLAFVTDKRGVLWANFPVFPEAIGKDLSSRDWYQGTSARWKPYISKVFKLIVGDKPLAAAVCVPIIDEKERVIGILGTSQRLGFIDDIVQRVPLSPHTSVTVIDRAGQIIYSNIFSYLENITVHPFFPSIETALKKKQQQIEINNPQDNREKINLFVVPVGITGWSIIVGRTQSDIFRSEFKRFVELWGGSLLLFLLCIALLVYLRKVSLFRKTEELLQVEKELRQSENKYLSLFNQISSGVAVYEAVDGGEDFIFQDFNTAGETIEHLNREHLIGKRVTEIFPGVKEFGAFAVFQRVWKTGKQEYFPESLYKDDRNHGTWRESWVYKLPSGEIVSVYNDITERKQAIEKLHETNAYLENLINYANAPIIVWDVQFRITRFNHAFESLTGRTEADVLGKSLEMLFPPALVEGSMALIHKTMSGERWETVEIKILHLDESELTLLWNSATLFSPDGQTPIATIAQGVDITLRRQAEEKIKSSLQEKETLLKEIHHRVKNNLQIISSLLNLQTGYIGDDKMEGIFRECRDRITAMASVHALLYKSQNLAEIDFGEYVRETANQLFRSYKTGRMDISLVIQAENVLLPIDTAIPCGLIINELVTNALKHAFPQTGKGEIKIAMNRTALGIILLFEDNGIGFPKNTAFYQSETFGLKLVHLLVKQLDGSIEQVIDGGTRYTIMFKTATQQEA